MSRIWPYLPRPHESSLIHAALRSHRPVLLTGPAGIGKTSLTRAAVASAGRRIEWLAGSPSSRQVPLAALSTLMPVDGSGDVARMVAGLSAQLIGSRAVLAVEDAGQLDTATATVVAQLIQSEDHSGVIVMLRSATLDDADPALVAALASAHAERVEPATFSHDDLAAAIGEYLGAPMDYADIVSLCAACDGNPFYARHLVAGTVSAGAVHRRADGTFFIAEGFVASQELEAVVGSAVEAAGPQTRQLLEYLSVLTPLSVTTVSELGMSGALDAVTTDLVITDGRFVYPAHAILTEVVRGRMGGLRRTLLTSAVFDALSTTTDSPAAALQRARLAEEIGRSIPAQANLDASATAFNYGEFALSERLAALAAASPGASTFAAFQRVRAVAAQGDAVRAQRLLDDIDAGSLDDGELAGYVVTACVHYTTTTGEHDRSLALLDTIGSRITDPSLLGAMHAMRAATLLNAGRQAEALSSARACSTGQWDGTMWVALAGFVEAEVLRRLGEIRRPIMLGNDALRLASATSPLAGIGALRTLTLTHIAGGNLDAADTVALRFADTVALQSIPRAVACGTMSAVAVARGRFGKAQRLALDCLHALPDDDRNGLGRGVAAMLAGIRAMLGDVDGARWAQQRCESATLRAGDWSEVNPILSDGFVRAAGGEMTVPIARFHRAAQISFAHQHVADGINSLYWAVRFGDRDAARQLCERRRHSEGPVTALMVDHARALLAGDADRLQQVGDAFAELGYIPFAADAIAHTMVALIAEGSPREAHKFSPRLAFLRHMADDFTSPAILTAELGVGLSPRELEVHSMTVAGRTRADIAQTLGIRPSSVTAYRSRVRGRLGA